MSCFSTYMYVFRSGLSTVQYCLCNTVCAILRKTAASTISVYCTVVSVTYNALVMIYETVTCTLYVIMHSLWSAEVPYTNYGGNAFELLTQSGTLVYTG